MNEDFLELLSSLLAASARFLEGISFADAWPNRIEGDFGEGVRCPVIGLDDIITNKRAAARPQDLADVAVLERIREARGTSG